MTKVKCGEFYNEVTVKERIQINLMKQEILFLKICRYIKQLFKEWFNLTFNISVVALVCYVIIVYSIGKIYYGKSLGETIWDNKNMLFTFLVAPNLIKFSLKVSLKKEQNKRRHELYIDIFLSFREIAETFMSENFDGIFEDKFIYTKENFEEYVDSVEDKKFYTVDAQKFLLFCKELEEEIPLLNIEKVINEYTYKLDDIKKVVSTIDTYKRRSKIIRSRADGSKEIMLDNFKEYVSYYIEVIEIVGECEEYRKDKKIYKKMVEICMKHEVNHERMKRQYDLACVTGIGYQIPDSDYDIG